jgi:membrane-associated phospholipid phosphatase
MPVRTFSSAVLALALLAGAARAAEPLAVDWKRDGAIVGAALLVGGGLTVFEDDLTPDRCRFCDPNAFDRAGRDALRWSTPSRARLASDVLANGVLPAAVLLHAVGAGFVEGGARRTAEDVTSVVEAVLIATDLNLLVKGAAGRLRPYAWASGSSGGTDANRSFYSGHTSLAFSLAAAAGTVATLRKYRSARWVWAIGMPLAAGVAYLRVAGDAHWVTDVLTGAAVGGAIGFAVPWTLHRPRGGRGTGLELYPAPGGFALKF